MRPPKIDFVQADANALPFPDGHFHAVVTSIPYYRQRKYGDDAREVGREETPDQFVEGIADAFDRIARVIRPDGIVFLNVGDTYAGSCGTGGTGKETIQPNAVSAAARRNVQVPDTKRKEAPGLPDKSLIGIPWRIALEMQRRGWVLRAEIIWAKSISFGDAHAENVRRAVRARARALGVSKDVAASIAEAVEPQVGACMPSSVRDRPTVSHETVFMFAGQPKYHVDFMGMREPAKDWGSRDRSKWKYRQDGYASGHAAHGGCKDNDFAEKGRNVRSVWTINTQPYHGSKHYATFPERLAEKMVRAATSEGGCCEACGAPFARVVDRRKVERERPRDYVKRTGEAGTGNRCANTVAGVASRTVGFRPTCDCGVDQGVITPVPVPCRVLDPFGGVGTTAIAADALGRDCTIVDLYPEYLDEARNRLLKRRAASGTTADRNSDESEIDEEDPDQLELCGKEGDE